MDQPSATTPLLGTNWVQAQLTLDQKNNSETPTMDAIPTPSLCLDLTEFRRHLQRYRKLDDSINLSLNKTFMLLVNSSAEFNPPPSASTSHTQCAQFWKLLTKSWLDREKLIKSCVKMMDESVENKKRDSNQDAELVKKKEWKSGLHTIELKRRVIRDELAVESAIRKQTMQKFRIRCPESLFSIPHDSPPVDLNSQPTSH